MIAGALGVRPPKKTEEMKRYEKAALDKERAKRDKEREGRKKEEDEREKAKAAVWDD